MKSEHFRIVLIVLAGSLFALVYFSPPVSPDIIEDTDIRPVADTLTLSSEGALQGVFENRIPFPVRVTEFEAVDEYDIMKRCKTDFDLTVPPGGRFDIILGGCGLRSSGDEYMLNVWISYDVLTPNDSISSSTAGILSGAVI
jgi:hypothetical protein